MIWELIHHFLQTSRKETIDTQAPCSQQNQEECQDTQSRVREAPAGQELPAELGKRALRACGDNDQGMGGSHPETRKVRELNASSTPDPY